MEADLGVEICDLQKFPELQRFQNIYVDNRSHLKRRGYRRAVRPESEYPLNPFAGWKMFRVFRMSTETDEDSIFISEVSIIPVEISVWNSLYKKSIKFRTAEYHLWRESDLIFKIPLSVLSEENSGSAVPPFLVDGLVSRPIQKTYTADRGLLFYGYM